MCATMAQESFSSASTPGGHDEDDARAIRGELSPAETAFAGRARVADQCVAAETVILHPPVDAVVTYAWDARRGRNLHVAWPANIPELARYEPETNADAKTPFDRTRTPRDSILVVKKGASVHGAGAKNNRAGAETGVVDCTKIDVPSLKTPRFPTAQAREASARWPQLLLRGQTHRRLNAYGPGGRATGHEAHGRAGLEAGRRRRRRRQRRRRDVFGFDAARDDSRDARRASRRRDRREAKAGRFIFDVFFRFEVGARRDPQPDRRMRSARARDARLDGRAPSRRDVARRAPRRARPRRRLRRLRRLVDGFRSRRDRLRCRFAFARRTEPYLWVRRRGGPRAGVRLGVAAALALEAARAGRPRAALDDAHLPGRAGSETRRRADARRRRRRRRDPRRGGE
jgi:hypothetical protein